jgi:carboxypeptidase Taq
MKKRIERLKELDKDIQLLTHSTALLAWDQETYMPKRALEERSEQISLLEGIVHGRVTDPEIGDLLEESGNESLNDMDRAFLRELRHRYNRLTKLPVTLVKELAKETSLAQAKWAEARSKSDFSLFAPHLQRLLDLTLEKAERLGYKESIYDPLLDEFEPWMKTNDVEAVFSVLQNQLKNLLAKIIKSPHKIDTSMLHREYPVDKQKSFSLDVLKRMGYDFKAGRLDVSAHPFTTSLGIADIRLTTRYQKDFFNTGIFGSIHEGGHGLYELGIGRELAGTLLAGGTSMGIHESQSRMWENMIGRSLHFWKFFFPKLKDLFPDAFCNTEINAFYRAINKVEPSLIRTEADEVTYNLHIILRFNLEKKLIEGQLAVDDLPEAWKRESMDLLGLQSEDDALGVLQDIHWSMAAFGYFPTYCLGNLYAAQFYHILKKEIPDLEKDIQEGQFERILKWTSEKIHCHGAVFPARELCLKVSGEELAANHFVSYLTDKFGDIYEL